ncbi:hypothetical protein ACTXT7_004652 [Hymenolepis weldensis]
MSLSYTSCMSLPPNVIYLTLTRHNGLSEEEDRELSEITCMLDNWKMSEEGKEEGGVVSTDLDSRIVRDRRNKQSSTFFHPKSISFISFDPTNGGDVNDSVAIEIYQTAPTNESSTSDSVATDINRTGNDTDEIAIPVHSVVKLLLQIPTANNMKELCMNLTFIMLFGTGREKPFKCDHCEKAYTQAHSLKKHKEKRHVRSIGSLEHGNWTEERESVESTTAFETLLIE